MTPVPDDPHPSPTVHPDDDAESGDVSPVTDETLLHWARRFIEDLAAGGHADLHSLAGEPFERHVALAQVVPEKLRDRRAAVRRAAAWVAGAADAYDEATIPLLARLLRDRSPLTRMAGAWACREIGEDAAAAVPALAAALVDPSGGVRLAAVCGLRGIGPAAAPAVPDLLTVAEAPPAGHRAEAVKALADIAPDDPAVRERVLRALESPDRVQRFAGAYGVARAAEPPAGALPRLADTLASADPPLVAVTAWAIGKLAGTPGPSPAPALLDALRRTHWMRVEYNEMPGDEFVSIRSALGDALACHLPATDDPDYEDFRRAFFLHAFRPPAAGDDGWIGEIASHPWYLKLQRRRFGHPSTAAERQAVREMLAEAREKFAARIRRNPTLGLEPGDYARLPGFIKNHTRNIAWSLARGRKRARARRAERDVLGTADQYPGPRAGPDMAPELLEVIEVALPAGERDVARSRWLEGLTVIETAAALGITPSQVRTRERHARQRLRTRLA